MKGIVSFPLKKYLFLKIALFGAHKPTQNCSSSQKII